MRVLGIVLIVLGAGAAVPASITWIGDRSDATRTAEHLLQIEQEHAATMEELQETNLRYRGYQKSVPQIPDSIRAAESSIISGRYKDYNKKITALEMKDVEERRSMDRARRKRAERAAEARAGLLPFAAGALVLLLAGAVILRRA